MIITLVNCKFIVRMFKAVDDSNLKLVKQWCGFKKKKDEI